MLHSDQKPFFLIVCYEWDILKKMDHIFWPRMELSSSSKSLASSWFWFHIAGKKGNSSSGPSLKFSSFELSSSNLTSSLGFISIICLSGIISIF